MTTLDILAGAPRLTLALAGGSLLLGLALWSYGLYRWRRWGRAIWELSEIRIRHLNTSDYESRSHRQLHDAFNSFKSYLDGLLQKAPDGALIVKPILDEVTQYQRSSVAGGDSGWSDLVARHLDVLHRPLRWMRAAAGWVVLLGLAGTVLGFFEALPGLSDAFSPSALPKLPAGSAAIPVLGSLGGVFFATLAGICAALWLYSWAMVFERRYERLAGEIEILGRRWFVPLMQSPDTVLDKAVGEKLDAIFLGLSEQLAAILGPPIEAFAGSLKTISEVAGDFSNNIESGSRAVESFQAATGLLLVATEKADRQVTKLTENMRLLGEHIQRVVQQGDEKLIEAADLLATPARSLAKSTETIRKTVEMTVPQIEKIGEASLQISASHRVEIAQLGELRQQLGRIENSLDVSAHGMSKLDATLKEVAAAQAELLPELQRLGAAAPDLTALRREIPEIERLLSAQESRFADLTSQVLSFRDRVAGVVGSRLEPWLGKVFTGLATREEQALKRQGEALDLLRRSLSEIRDEIRAAEENSASPGLLRKIAESIDEANRMHGNVLAALRADLETARAEPASPDIWPSLPESVGLIDAAEALEPALPKARMPSAGSDQAGKGNRRL